ncbi:hypothetical protein [Mesorhizobium sp. STM 4661]|uniref:hypothetical protein n=1 Tax=Mesorhizobium sp. STM 4661 TaxID=1297570 RepID=UPI0002BE7009|nr:hypothetical protein [Mesorhizobium sp. STM 4661]CCV12981.1 hypothetical protein MESS4_510148 [Mesorhizobium sp. STM 4661]
MLIAQQDFVAQTGGISETKAFGFEMNGFAFHTVISGIYADKLRAPFRELATNARDGHAAKGNLYQPFDVFLPSKLDPTFKVRDYGISLSHEEIMGIYTTMFASTKRGSNEATGMIGLGSKSPFAYTSVFTVIAYLGDYKRTYSAFIGTDGVPQIALLDMCQTTEPDGVEVSFPVKVEDVDKFRNIAPDVLFGFDPFPNILNEQFVRPAPVTLYQGMAGLSTMLRLYRLEPNSWLGKVGSAIRSRRPRSASQAHSSTGPSSSTSRLVTCQLPPLAKLSATTVAL